MATHGLTLNAPHRQREGLARWLRDEAARHGRRDLALHAGWIALGAYPLAEHYRWLRTWLHDEWDRHREQALQTVELASANINNIDEQVEIYLMEQMFDKAMALVEKNPLSSKLGQVIDAVRATHPRWAFEQCYRQAACDHEQGACLSVYRRRHVAAKRTGHPPRKRSPRGLEYRLKRSDPETRQEIQIASYAGAVETVNWASGRPISPFSQCGRRVAEDEEQRRIGTQTPTRYYGL
jgi:hypothetical protein